MAKQITSLCSETSNVANESPQEDAAASVKRTDKQRTRKKALLLYEKYLLAEIRLAGTREASRGHDRLQGRLEKLLDTVRKGE